MKKKGIEIVLLTGSVILMMIPKVIAPVCTVEVATKPMKCFYMGRSIFVLGIILLLLSLMALISKDKSFKKGLILGHFLLNIYAVYLSKWGIGGCMNHMMSCQLRTIPSILFVSIVLILADGIVLLIEHRRGSV